jgi:hypothetical protein
MRKACFALLFLSALGRAQLTPPRIGFISDREGALRPVIGVSANFLLGDAVAQSVLSAGYSGTFGFVKTETSLTVLSDSVNAYFPTSPGPALFSFFGTTGFVYFAATGAVAHWDGANLTYLKLDPFPGDVLALGQPDATHLLLAVRLDKSVYALQFDTTTGSLQSSVPLGAFAGNVALVNGADYLYANRTGLVLHRSTGSDIPLDKSLTSGVSFAQLGADWWSIKDSGGRQFAVHTQTGHESFYQLPENAR